jgi:uncharacterized protein YjbJ (UPF0337 family)
MVHGIRFLDRMLSSIGGAGVKFRRHRTQSDLNKFEQPEISREADMNWDQVEGKWKQYKGQAKEKWGKLTDDDLDVIDGRRQQLVGRIQERYGIAREAAEKQADEFLKTLKSEDVEEDRAYRAGQR